MKYFKITDQSIDLEEKPKGLVADIPSANGQYVPNYEYYFDRIGSGEIIKDAPIFNYFHLQSFGSEEEWEWRLQDIHGGMGKYPTGAYWYISDDFKLLLENFKIAPKYHFYETKLLYKGRKLKYWIFQFPIGPLQNINFEKSRFILDEDNIVYIFKNMEDYLLFYRQEYKSTKRKLHCSKIVFQNYYDLVVSSNNDKIISEPLKKAIETIGLKGFIFRELDYEVAIA